MLQQIIRKSIQSIVLIAVLAMSPAMFAEEYEWSIHGIPPEETMMLPQGVSGVAPVRLATYESYEGSIHGIPPEEAVMRAPVASRADEMPKVELAVGYEGSVHGIPPEEAVTIVRSTTNVDRPKIAGTVQSDECRSC